jgi:Zn-dependent protease with chaperone function
MHPAAASVAAKSFASIFMLGALISCSGVEHRMPEVSEANEKAALAEIESHSLSPTRMSSDAAQNMLFDVYARLKPAAYDVCTHVDENRHCAWQVRYVVTDQVNAYAAPGNVIMVSHGMIEAMETEDQLAFVVGHEISHQIADHLSETRSQMAAGSMIGATAMAAATRGTATCTTYACQQGMTEAARGSVGLGGQIGGLVYSKKQEAEADYLSVYMLELAGFDLQQARLALVKIGVLTNKEKTSITDTHPAGPERLANYDEVVRIVQSDADGFPGSDDRATEESKPKPSPVQAVSDEDKRKCRIYIPEDDICIH